MADRKVSNVVRRIARSGLHDRVFGARVK
jgi:hypothetical protein